MSWFSGLFRKAGAAVQADPPVGASSEPVSPPDPPEEDAVPPEVVAAPVLWDVDPDPPSDEAIRIRAELAADRGAVILRANRMLLPNWSWYGCSVQDAYAGSPLAEALFQAGPVNAVVIRDHIVEIRLAAEPGNLEAAARQFGTILRTYLESGRPAVFPEIYEGFPPEAELARRTAQILEREINPMVRDHGGAVRLERVSGNTVFVRMEGGCQGCSASDATLSQGVEKMIRQAVPEIGAIVDVTAHEEGANPYYR